MKWTKQIQRLDQGNSTPHSKAYIREFCEAKYSAGNWDCCSLGEKMKQIDPAWTKLTSRDQNAILELYPLLEDMGWVFHEDIMNMDFDKALETHNKIKAFDVDEDRIRQFIKDQTS